jgi:hypothetical protein
MWIYAAIAIALIIAGIVAWKMYSSESVPSSAESFYSTMAPPKNFPEVIGLPLHDAKAYLSKHGDKYQIRTVSTYDESYRQDLSTIYILVDGSNTVTDVL